MATFDRFTVESSVLSNAECMALAVNGRLREVFGVNEDGTFTPDIERLRTWAVDVVNRQAGEARSEVGTNIPFQGDVYQLKEREVTGYQADTDPSAAKYPVLYAEAGARGMDVAAVAAEYAANAQLWPQLIAAIEAQRMGAITAIKAASTVAEIEAILAGLE